MKPWLRPWPVRVLRALRELIDGPARPIVENSLARTRRLQRRVAREANRHPFVATTTGPRFARGPQDRGFE